MSIPVSQREVFIAASPTHDSWAAFREIEVINLHFEQDYSHSLGKVSKFFLALEAGQLLGTHCSVCGRVYMPPRPLCPRCIQVTSWQALPLTGTVQTFSVMHFGSGINADVSALPTPYVLAYVQIDGASTLLAHILKAAPEAVQAGMRVRVEFATAPVEHPIHLMHFVPLEV
jgi:uncharacterized OB-fold protein